MLLPFGICRKQILRQSLALRMYTWDKPLREGEGGLGQSQGKSEQGNAPLLHSLTQPQGRPGSWNHLSELRCSEAKMAGVLYPHLTGWLPASSSLQTKELTARGCLPTVSSCCRGLPSSVCLCIHYECIPWCMSYESKTFYMASDVDFSKLFFTWGLSWQFSINLQIQHISLFMYPYLLY